MTPREVRLAAMLARRAERPADTSPRCSISGCASHLYRADRCSAHFAPMRNLVAGMAGDRIGDRVSRRAFSEAMATTTMQLSRWGDLAAYDAAGDQDEIDRLLDEATDALFAAGWYIGKGPRGGGYLVHRKTAAA